MVTITLMGRDFDVAPYRIKQLRQAAPFIMAINGKIGSLTSLEAAVDVSADMCGFLAIGMSKIDPTFTQDYLEDNVGLDAIVDLQKAVMDVLTASGLKPGEAPAPSAEPAPQGA